jgi:hypothetical protein
VPHRPGGSRPGVPGADRRWRTPPDRLTAVPCERPSWRTVVSYPLTASCQTLIRAAAPRGGSSVPAPVLDRVKRCPGEHRDLWGGGRR